MTIKEAFAQYGEIDIAFVWQTPCKRCGNDIEEEDDTFGFSGDIDYFTGEFAQENDFMQLEDEITPIEGNRFYFYQEHAETGDICPACQVKEKYGDELTADTLETAIATQLGLADWYLNGATLDTDPAVLAKADRFTAKAAAFAELLQGYFNQDIKEIEADIWKREWKINLIRSEGRKRPAE